MKNSESAQTLFAVVWFFALYLPSGLSGQWAMAGPVSHGWASQPWPGCSTHFQMFFHTRNKCTSVHTSHWSSILLYAGTMPYSSYMVTDFLEMCQLMWKHVWGQFCPEVGWRAVSDALMPHQQHSYNLLPIFITLHEVEINEWQMLLQSTNIKTKRELH